MREQSILVGSVAPRPAEGESVMSDQLSFEGKVAVVTGAGGGLGRAHALLLASRGAKVVVNDLGGSLSGEGSDAGPAQSTVDEIKALGGEATADRNSVATVEGGQALIDTATDTYGRLDILVNNAGILRNAPFEDMDEAHLEPLLDVHLRGAFFVTRPAWNVMRAQGQGRIVNTTSGAGLLGAPGFSNYGAAKGGVYGLTRVLAIEGVQYGIKVNAIAPFAATRMLSDSMDAPVDVTDEAAMAQMQQIAAALDPALVSPVVAYLAHDDCDVTGEIFSVGGGQVSRFFLGRTDGYFGGHGLSIEDVRDHLPQIRDDKAGYSIPKDTGDESRLLFAAIARANGS
jgi:NAD(P)-dependent dehydrogenase (short-subunit alcohol dehydrogenase family)